MGRWDFTDKSSIDDRDRKRKLLKKQKEAMDRTRQLYPVEVLRVACLAVLKPD